MKVSLNWLKEFVDVDLTIEQLVEKIGAQLGAVEEVIHLAPKYEGIIVANVVSCVKHPNADKLSLCKIDDGKKAKDVERDKDGYVQVVCGAPNVREGLLVAWLPPGTTVPASYDKDPFKLEAREIRGQVSNGMLASASELDLGNDHSGIATLSFGEPGEDFAKLVGLDDYIIDIENKMFTHRPDCFGIVGVAREIAGITGQAFTSPAVFQAANLPKSGKTTQNLGLQVHNDIQKLVPRFMAQVIEGVEVKPSPIWMQAYLSRVGIRPINNIVDVTNYAMYLTGQPLHAYDYDKLCKVAKTAEARLETRLSKKGDKLKLLNGKSITFEDEETILITSNDMPVGIGGVMGGADTEVDMDTKNVVLECASFDMYAIRRASMRHGLFTDAVTRFNKGQSSLQNPPILQRSVAWASDYSGGEIGKLVDAHGQLRQPIAVHATSEFINGRLGFDMGIKDMARLLQNVEFEVRINGPTLAVTPPYWRTDIEIAEDIVEEIGRLHGYDHLPLELPRRTIAPPARLSALDTRQHIRRTLAAAGANEVLTYSFVHGDLIDKVGQDKRLAFKLTNALSPELQYYRMSLTPSLLDKVHMNVKAGHDHFAIFEIGKAHQKGVMEKGSKLPKEEPLTSLVYIDDRKQRPKGAAYYQAVRYLDELLTSINVRYRLEAYKHDHKDKDDQQTSAPFSDKRSARVVVNDKLIGFVGEYAPSIYRGLKLPGYAAGFEISLDTLAVNDPMYQALSKYPSLSQDICLRVARDVTYQQLYELVSQTLSNTDEAVVITPVDIYQKEKLSKQITFRITVTSHERTLKDAYVSKLLDEVAEVVHKKLGAVRV